MHLFFIHSHSSYYSAVAAAQHEGLDPGEVVFLTSRHHESFRPLFRLLPVSTSVPRTWRPGRARRFLRDLDASLTELVHGRRFHWYVPHTRFRYVQVVKTHPLCAGFSFLEEGLAAYRSLEQVAEIYAAVPRKLRDRISYPGRIPAAMHFYDPGHTKAYGLYENAFLGLPGRVVLPDWQRNVVRRTDLSLRHVLVFDGSSSAGIVRLDSVLAGLRRLLQELQRRDLGEVHYKWHPAQLGRSPERPRILDTFARHGGSLRMVEVPVDTSLEEVALSCPGVEFFVNTSSAGFYAALCGCSVSSFARHVAEADPGFWSVVNALPRQYWELVTML